MVCKPIYLLLLWQASVETAEDYTKRKFVFRLHTSDGSEFLFSADSEDQQEEWVKKIRFHAALPPSQQLTQYRDFDETKENEFTPPEPHIHGADFIFIMWKKLHTLFYSNCHIRTVVRKRSSKQHRSFSTCKVRIRIFS